MYELYEIVTYTASVSTYADPLLDRIDPLRRVSYRLFREHCTAYNNGFIKDLSKLGRDLKSVIIVDNTPTAYLLQRENAIPITTWIDDVHDRELFELSLLLEALAYVNDVTKVIKQVVINESVDYMKAARSVAKLLSLENKVSLKINHLVKDNAKTRKGLQKKGGKKKVSNSRQKDIYTELNNALQAKLNQRTSRNKSSKKPHDGSIKKNCITIRRLSKGSPRNCTTTKYKRKEDIIGSKPGTSLKKIKKHPVTERNNCRSAIPQSISSIEFPLNLYNNVALIYKKLRTLNSKKQPKKFINGEKHYTLTGNNILCDLEESANRQLNLHSNSLDNTDWVACHEQYKSENLIKSKKNALEKNKIQKLKTKLNKVLKQKK